MWPCGDHPEKSGHFGKYFIDPIFNINKYTKLYLSANFHVFFSQNAQLFHETAGLYVLHCQM